MAEAGESGVSSSSSRSSTSTRCAIWRRNPGRPGIDAIYFGTGDLAGSLGLPPEAAHPALEEAIATVVRKARQRGVCVGQSAEDDVAGALQLIANGVQMIAVGDDFRLLANSVDRLINGIRGSGS